MEDKSIVEETLLTTMYNEIHKLQIMSGLQAHVQFQVHKEHLCYIVIVADERTGQEKGIPMYITTEDIEGNSNREIIQKTFNDIHAELEKLSVAPSNIPNLVIVGR